MKERFLQIGAAIFFIGMFIYIFLFGGEFHPFGGDTYNGVRMTRCLLARLRRGETIDDYYDTREEGWIGRWW